MTFITPNMSISYFWSGLATYHIWFCVSLFWDLRNRLGGAWGHVSSIMRTSITPHKCPFTLFLVMSCYVPFFFCVSLFWDLRNRLGGAWEHVSSYIRTSITPHKFPFPFFLVMSCFVPIFFLWIFLETFGTVWIFLETFGAVLVVYGMTYHRWSMVWLSELSWWCMRTCLTIIVYELSELSHYHRVWSHLSLSRQKCLCLLSISVCCRYLLLFPKISVFLLATPKRLAEPQWSSTRTCITQKISFIGVLCPVAI